MKLIFDTNIWVSYFISKSFDEILEILNNDYFNVIFSEELIGEIRIVLERPKFQRVINKTHIKDIINLIISRCSFYYPEIELELCRDQKDDFLLKLCEVSNADYLITGDNDLLVLGNYKSTKILKWSNFITILKEYKLL
ncbi:MAG: putative toxin-antitoxin system toxin component, PIN family [Spirochaetes bacterium]|nr:putative toxin-antitoxin system toxin component, PIN family [Spirochaetota bacterium]